MTGSRRGKHAGRLRVVEVKYMMAPDAEDRLRRAVQILLGAADVAGNLRDNFDRKEAGDM